MAEKHKVGSVSALAAGKPLSAKIEKQNIAVFMINGTVIAIEGKCPHAGGPLHKGELDGTKLSCPWHGWTYDLTSGACEEDPEVWLPTFPVQVEGDDIFVLL